MDAVIRISMDNAAFEGNQGGEAPYLLGTFASGTASAHASCLGFNPADDARVSSVGVGT